MFLALVTTFLTLGLPEMFKIALYVGVGILIAAFVPAIPSAIRSVL